MVPAHPVDRRAGGAARRVVGSRRPPSRLHRRAGGSFRGSRGPTPARSRDRVRHERPSLLGSHAGAPRGGGRPPLTVGGGPDRGRRGHRSRAARGPGHRRSGPCGAGLSRIGRLTPGVPSQRLCSSTQVSVTPASPLPSDKRPQRARDVTDVERCLVQRSPTSCRPVTAE